MTIGESIKQLLEERKRVILPGFGNLEIKESSGGISSSSKRIDPPGLTIRFDSSFSKDDGLLSTAFAEAGGVNKEEAEQQVLELVDAIRFALDKGEPYSLNDAGIFRRDDEGKIHFQPNPSWVLEPDQYGLGSMELLELEDFPVEEVEPSGISSGTSEIGEEEGSLVDAGPLLELSEGEEIEPEKKPVEKPVAKLVTRRSSKPFSSQVSKPVEPQKSEKTKRRLSLWRVIWFITGILIVVLVIMLLIPKQPQQPVQSEKPETRPEVSDKPAPASEQVKPAMIELEPEPEPEQVVEQTNHFFIVAGSFKNLANAIELQDKLKARGYPAELMITENRMYRVSVANYATTGEAERNLTRIKSESGMESCWLLSNE